MRCQVNHFVTCAFMKRSGILGYPRMVPCAAVVSMFRLACPALLVVSFQFWCCRKASFVSKKLDVSVSLCKGSCICCVSSFIAVRTGFSQLKHFRCSKSQVGAANTRQVQIQALLTKHLKHLPTKNNSIFPTQRQQHSIQISLQSHLGMQSQYMKVCQKIGLKQVSASRAQL